MKSLIIVPAIGIVIFVLLLIGVSQAVHPPGRVLEIDVESYLLCRSDSTHLQCIPLPQGAKLIIPQAIPPGPWDAFSAKRRL